jgi:pyridoxine kinase
MEAKRILAVHDLSCYGAASLGIVIPMLTAFGYKVVAFPSVILSSTTDLDRDPVALDTTEWMYKVVTRWKEQRMTFDAIYTGWLGDPRQIALLINLCEQSQHEKTTIFIDPVLGDGGALYPCQEELAKVMNGLVGIAHVITPNPTEAALLLGKQPRDCGVEEDGTVTVDNVYELANALALVYPRALPIIKSVVSENRIGVCVRFTSDNTMGVKKPVTKIILGTRMTAPSVGGTGDLFASLLIGHWLKNDQSNQYDKVIMIESVVKTISKVMMTVQRGKKKDLPFRDLLHIN